MDLVYAIQLSGEYIVSNLLTNDCGGPDAIMAEIRERKCQTHCIFCSCEFVCASVLILSERLYDVYL